MISGDERGDVNKVTDWLSTWPDRTRRTHNEQLVFVIDITHARADDRLEQLSRPFPLGVRTTPDAHF